MREALTFFKSEPVYGKLFLAFRKKYESLGRIGGNVTAAMFSEDELEQLAKFFGVTADQLRRKGSVSLLDFERQLFETRFSELDLKALLDAYFGEEIRSKRQQEAERHNRICNLLLALREEFPALSFWLDCLIAQPAEARWIIQIAEQDEDNFCSMAERLHDCLLHLPESPVRLPFFSQQITGDPHAFDLNTELGKLLLHTLVVLKNRNEMEVERKEEKCIIPTATEDVNELLNSFNIYRDDLLNFVTLANFLAIAKEGKDYPVWRAAVEVGAVLHVPLREIVTLSAIRPLSGKHVWIVENSGVCSELLAHLPGLPIISTNGQFKLASLLMMDSLVKSGFQLHYSGDFDPEGLSMAQRLLERYPGQIELWCMDINSYRLSNPMKKLESDRLAKCNGIDHPELIELASVIKEDGKAGYQEAIVEEMMNRIM
ncbi:uncharacterized protein (TIGR02679 family) [Sporosarcina luteola]|nr:uncharacterized protein (TIGR02679 family) [Sporosarcina luteola]